MGVGERNTGKNLFRLAWYALLVGSKTQLERGFAMLPVMQIKNLVPDNKSYTARLQAGLGLVSETKTLLSLWSPGMSANQLYRVALESGQFPTITARRLRNIVVECFAPRYLVSGGAPAAYLKRFSVAFSTADLTQLMLIFTSRANPILGDFVRYVYWARYAGGYEQVANDDSYWFVRRAMDDGLTAKCWPETTVRRVSACLTGCCANYGMLERGKKTSRRILPFRISPVTVAYLAYELHFSGIGDNALLTHEDWQLFGLGREDVLEEIRKLSLRGLLVFQSVGGVIRVSWKSINMDALCDILIRG